MCGPLRFLQCYSTESWLENPRNFDGIIRKHGGLSNGDLLVYQRSNCLHLVSPRSNLRCAERDWNIHPHMVTIPVQWSIHPLKTNMEPEHTPLQKEKQRNIYKGPIFEFHLLVFGLWPCRVNRYSSPIGFQELASLSKWLQMDSASERQQLQVGGGLRCWRWAQL